MSADGDQIAEAERLEALVDGHPENVDAALPLLLELLRSSSPDVVAAVVHALGKTWDERGCLAVLPFADHPDPAVRLEVAICAPGGLESDSATAEVAAVLIRLSRDDVDEIRDWATFGLGSILEIDTDEVRDALADRLEDPHPDTYCEAVIGLAERHDERAFVPTLTLLESDSVPRLAVDSARALGDHRLLEALRRLEAWWDVDEGMLQLAIERCQPDDVTRPRDGLVE